MKCPKCNYNIRTAGKKMADAQSTVVVEEENKIEEKQDGLE